jgi:hypothetical protein
MKISTASHARACVQFLINFVQNNMPLDPLAAWDLKQVVRALRGSSRVAVEEGGDIVIETPGFFSSGCFLFKLWRRNVRVVDSIDRFVDEDYKAVIRI